MDARSDKAAIPLAVDLDGTLIATDLLFEGLFLLLRKQPLAIFLVPFWLLGGVARLKHEIAERVDLDPASLPYREEIIEMLRAERAAGRKIILATGTPKRFADAIAAYLGLFDEVMATDAGHNLTSGRKSRALVEAYGDAGFDYAGNSRHDLKVFDSARASIVVAPDRAASRWQRQNNATLIPGQKPTWKTLVKMLRVHQWLKNVLVAVPLLLSHEDWSAGMALACVLAFASFSAAASAIYIINDFFDLALDRKHPTKRKRPFASGVLSMPFGMVCSALLLAISFGLAALLPAEYMLVLCVYVISTTAYSLSIKRMLLVDVMMLAFLYTLRIIAGTAATGADSSFWLLAFSMFFFLSLALVKRFVELRNTRLIEGERIAGRGYRAEDREVVAQAGMASAFAAALVMALYLDSDSVRVQYGHPEMVWPLVPIILYMTMRIWILARRGEMHDDPVVFIIRDWRSQLVAGFGGLLLMAAAFWP